MESSLYRKESENFLTAKEDNFLTFPTIYELISREIKAAGLKVIWGKQKRKITQIAVSSEIRTLLYANLN